MFGNELEAGNRLRRDFRADPIAGKNGNAMGMHAAHACSSSEFETRLSRKSANQAELIVPRRSASALNSANNSEAGSLERSKPSSKALARKAWRPLCLPRTIELHLRPNSSG